MEIFGLALMEEVSASLMAKVSQIIGNFMRVLFIA